MRAEVTDTFDLILHWDFKGTSSLRFSPCSKCEFEITADIELHGGLNYQGRPKIQFLTTCYAISLQWFAKGLRAFASGEAATVKYSGSNDLEIRIGPNPGDCRKEGAMPVTCELHFDYFRYPAGTAKLCIPLGPPEAPLDVAKAIEDVLASLEMDCRPLMELPSHESPPGP